MPKIHIDKVYPKGHSYPMIINFQNGYPTENFQAKTCMLLENETTKRKCVTVESNNMLYAGDEESEPLGRTLILVHNRKTGKARLIEVGCAQLKPILHLDNEVESLQDTSFLALSRKFGSKKQKQRVEHREKLRVNVQTVTEQMKTATENIAPEKLDLSSYEKIDSDDFYIPPINRDAAKPEDVYDIDQMLTEEEYEKIYSELEGKDYASNFLPFIASITKKKLVWRKNVLAVYADSLIKCANTLIKNIRMKNYAACPYSTTLNDIIIKKFLIMQNGKLCRTSPHKDKAICYAIVFCLLINGLHFELEGFSQAVKCAPSTVIKKARVTGASIANEGGKKIVKLKVPIVSAILTRRKSAKF